jgi:hypothetical protein
MSEHSSGVGKWLAGIVAAVISGVAVFYMTEGRKTEPLPTPISIDPPVIKSPEVFDVPAPPKAPQVLDISGNWQGVLYQQLQNGTIAPYYYDLNLTQNGNTIDGTARLQVPPPYGYGIAMRIRGTLSSDVLNFDDGLVIANSAPPGWLWCQKSVRLTYDQSNTTLQGIWSAPGCGSGQLNLSR